jgi:bifunctional DNA-binding transcriptional regulator/antitoxin component of YhaV-PrlF toxin-antitoxin module
MNSTHSTEVSTSVTELGQLVVRPKGARRMLNCGQTRLYELIAAGELDSFLDGRSRKITVESIHRYIRRRLEQTASGRGKDRTGGPA